MISAEDFLITPFLLGLSVGVYCFGFCVPFLVPLIVLKKRTSRQAVTFLVQFLSGRLLGYLLFGAVLGFLGEKIHSHSINILMILGITFVSLLMIFQGLEGEGKAVNRFLSKFHHSLNLSAISKKTPFFLGFLLGINICPPFLLAVFYVFALHSVFKGLVYFFMFFLATSVYILPVFFLQKLSLQKEFRKAARIASVFVGILFFLWGVYHITKGIGITHYF